MTAKVHWLGTPKSINTIYEESLAEAFFTNQDVLTSQSVLVRESIQNAIDAKGSENLGPVRMTFKLATVPSSTAKKYFSDLYPRIEAAGLGQTCLPDADSDCPILVVEDFNTTGLLGDLSAEEPNTKAGNSFWYFAWARGISSKGEGTRGKNGVGKIVFPRSSKIKSQLVYSVRVNPGHGVQGVVFGNALLKIHSLDGTKYEPDCRWMQELVETGEHRPFVDETVIDTFRTDWNLVRAADECGTSIVVPYCDAEFTAKNLVQCIIQDYFIALLDGTIVCTVVDFDGHTTELNSDTIEHHLTELDERLLTKTSKNATEIRALCDLYRSKLAGDVLTIEMNLPPGSKENSWGSTELSDGEIQAIRGRLESGGVVEFNIEALLPSEVGELTPRSSDWFSVLLRIKADVNSQAVFCREGILIPAASHSTNRVKDYVTLVTIHPGRLADTLGQAEGPSHERWSADEGKFKEKFVKSHGEDLIKFVRDSANRVTKLFLTKHNETEDSLFARWFPKVDAGAAPTVKKPGKKPRKATPGALAVGFRYERIDSGFRVLRSADKAVRVGTRATLKAGYSQLYGGSPLARSVDDFELAEHQGSLIGVKIINWDQNHVRFEVTQANFEMRFKGFDTYRDITVAVTT